MDVDAGLVGLCDALGSLRGEEVLDVPDETVAELAAHEAALERDLAEPHEEDHAAYRPGSP